ncbi:RNA polymerase II subunit 5-mediating protein homolog [Leptopilina heterotoma]|uniref:RNA polymerase II subunit 5-mediating protein homolog n=1 Tax=Leptopilina heterotoma TaxID=63436 RepID=UPI001CA9D75A|nr:RNA polymerase II subunit 5-mediating protein homolog [Leptopilina heterotoma]
MSPKKRKGKGSDDDIASSGGDGACQSSRDTSRSPLRGKDTTGRKEKKSGERHRTSDSPLRSRDKYLKEEDSRVEVDKGETKRDTKKRMDRKEALKEGELGTREEGEDAMVVEVSVDTLCMMRKASKVVNDMRDLVTNNNGCLDEPDDVLNGINRLRSARAGDRKRDEEEAELQLKFMILKEEEDEMMIDKFNNDEDEDFNADDDDDVEELANNSYYEEEKEIRMREEAIQYYEEEKILEKINNMEMIVDEEEKEEEYVI